MGEMELHVMAQRLQANKRAAAQRGELRTPLPVGYVHDEAGEVVTDPDAEVQAAVRDVFAAFAACGLAYGVVAAFAGRESAARLRRGVGRAAAEGRRTHARVLGILKNPGYAGAYVFGRYASHRTVEPSGTVHTTITERPRADWPVLIKTTTRATSPGRTTWPARPGWQPTTPPPAPGPRGRAPRCARGSSSAAAAASR